MNSFVYLSETSKINIYGVRSKRVVFFQLVTKSGHGDGLGGDDVLFLDLVPTILVYLLCSYDLFTFGIYCTLTQSLL